MYYYVTIFTRSSQLNYELFYDQPHPENEDIDWILTYIWYMIHFHSLSEYLSKEDISDPYL